MSRCIRNGLLITLGLLTASVAHAIPSMEVTVFDGNAKLAFKGATQANGTFATGDLRPGQYVVRFISKIAAVRGDSYLLILIAEKKPFISNPVAGGKFFGGGVAIRMDVTQPVRITGQVESARALARDKVEVINGKRYFWVKETGTNLSGRWIEEGSAGAVNVVSLHLRDLQQLQSRAGEGSLQGTMHKADLELGH